jgi:NAD(P)-dependent dehydrogenase (short-subunit alcohol dehydrogenase family)
MRLKDRVAIVTGGGSGIGQAIAEMFAQEGARVVVMDLLSERAQAVAQRINAAGGVALAVDANVANQREVETLAAQTLKAYGAIDILVNNASIAEGNDILEIDEDVWDANLDIVLKGVYLCSKAVLPTMIAQQRGAIVNIASVNALTALGHMAYSAAKAGVINLTKNMAVNYGQYNIRVNAISPGTIRTPIWEPRLAANPALFDELAKWYPLGRVGEPEDIAKAALFLASDDAAWVTGETLVVDGGLLAGSYRMTRDLEVQS